jgi:PAS domain-containing protein
VWRRTGEVCYANPEFCRLLGRTEADLCSKKSYIYHIFAKSSWVKSRQTHDSADRRVIAYWENFSVHAFENTTQNFFQPTSLQQITDEVVQCSACFTIRRDVSPSLSWITMAPQHVCIPVCPRLYV